MPGTSFNYNYYTNNRTHIKLSRNNQHVHIVAWPCANNNTKRMLVYTFRRNYETLYNPILIDTQDNTPARDAMSVTLLAQMFIL